MKRDKINLFHHIIIALLVIIIIVLLTNKSPQQSPINSVSYQGVLELLETCEILELDGLSGTCAQACIDNYRPSKTCAIGGFEQIDVSGSGGYAPNQYEWRMHHLFSCGDHKLFESDAINVFCICCSSPSKAISS